jgi:hypothetical protein
MIQGFVLFSLIVAEVLVRYRVRFGRTAAAPPSPAAPAPAPPTTPASPGAPA